MDKRVNEILTGNLIKMRMKHRYSQRQVASILQIAQPSYNRIESGKTTIKPFFLIRLAEFYCVMIDDFFIGYNSNGRNAID